MKSPYQNQMDQDQFGFLIASRLSDIEENLPHNVSERLRAARTRAVANRKIINVRTAGGAFESAGALTLGNERLSGWGRLAAAAPLLALALGLVFITVVQNDFRANELAEIDAALLTDDLPPEAYADPGFTHFLKLRLEQNQ